jgi:TolB-like protein/Tfp pilus assembly protein PilF
LTGAALAVPFARWAAPDAPAGAAERASVAVLPFVDTSPDRTQAHLGEGLAEEILNALIAVPGLRVPARASSFRFQDRDLPAAELARQLGVAAVLEGSVHRAGDSVRISARLLDAGTGRYLWSHTFTREFRDIFAVQAEIGRTVASALQVRLAPASPRPPTENVVAYELYLRGLFHWNRRTPLDLRLAIDFFTQATQRDASFAQPYAGLALTYVTLALLDPAATDLLPRTHDAAARALALDPSLAAAHAARAYAYHWQWQWQDAEREFRRALALDPSYATAHQWYGEHLAKMGRFREGEAHLRRAIQLDPLSLVAQNDLALVLMLARRFDDAVAQLERVRRLDPAFPLRLNLLHRVQLAAGNAPAAAEAGRGWAELTGSADPDELELLALATADSSLRPRAMAVLERWQREPKPRLADIAMYRMLMGDDQGALAVIERAVEARTPMMAGLKVAPWHGPLRRDPRMQALLRQMRFP